MTLVLEAGAPIGGLFPAPVGERLRAEREAQGIGLAEVSQRTRVPVRHLEAIEAGRLAQLPAVPYSAGFVKAYAQAVGLDPADLSRAFRSEVERAALGRIDSTPFEPADPKRLPPRGLAIIAALVALLLAAGFALWRSGVFAGNGASDRARLAAASDASPPPAATVPAQPAAAALPAPAASTGAVVLTARTPTWIRIYERSGATLFEGVLAAGQSYAVPASATDPLIRLGKAEAIAVSVAGRPAPPLGPPARVLRDVSLKAAARSAATSGASPAPGPEATPTTTATALPPAFAPGNDAAPARP